MNKDVLTPEQRSRCMAAIKGKDTKPEIAVRSMLDALKVKYELIEPTGNLTLSCPAERKIIFVHGCFWHAHRCQYGRVSIRDEPGSSGDEGKTKLRDRMNRTPLEKGRLKPTNARGVWTSSQRLTSRPEVTQLLALR